MPIRLASPVAGLVLCFVLAACGGGETADIAATRSLAEQRERLEGTWTQQCSIPVLHSSGQYGPEATLEKVSFVGPDANGVIHLTMTTEYHARQLQCYTYNATPYATVTWGAPFELRFAFIGYLQPSPLDPVDVYDVTRSTSPVVVLGSGVTKLPDGSWTIDFGNGYVASIPAVDTAINGQVAITPNAINNRPFAELTFNGSGGFRDANFVFHRDSVNP